MIVAISLFLIRQRVISFAKNNSARGVSFQAPSSAERHHRFPQRRPRDLPTESPAPALGLKVVDGTAHASAINGLARASVVIAFMSPMVAFTTFGLIICVAVCGLAKRRNRRRLPQAAGDQSQSSAS
jgi:hypothetical protein